MKKKGLLKRTIAVAVASAMVLTGVNFYPGSVKEAKAAEEDSTITLPNPTYYYDFEGATDAEKLQSKGIISGTETASEIKGGGSLATEDGNGYFDNASTKDLLATGEPEVEQNYLSMPTEIINQIYYSPTKAFTFSTKIKLVENKYGVYSPVFVMDGGGLTWPTFALELRGTAAWNAAGYYNGDNSTLDTGIATYNESDWNTLTYVVTDSSVKAYINGNLIQTINASTESDELCIKNIFNNGNTYFLSANRVSLGANQPFWGDPNAQVYFDDVAIYLEAFTEEQVKEIADNGVSTHIESVDIPDSKMMVKGDTTTLTPTYTPVSASSDATSVKFTSSDSDVASVNETTGEVTAVSAGEAKITVTVTTAHGEFTDICSITVSDKIISVDSVSAESSFTTLYVGGASAKITPSYTPEQVTVDTTPNYQSSNTSILTVDSDGMVTGIKEGTADVTVTIGGKTATVTFQVKDKVSVNGSWWTAFTPGYKVENNSIVEFNLNVKGGNLIWNNFAAVFTNSSTNGTVIPSAGTIDGYLEYAVVRGDNFGWGNGDNKSLSGNDITYTGGTAEMSENDLIEMMKSASINIKIAKSGNTITYIYTAIGENGTSTTRTATITEDTDDSLYVFFAPDTSTIICDNIHNYTLDTSAAGYQAPTCTQSGRGTFTCTDEGCAENIESDIAATGHSYAEGVVSKKATSELDGTITYTCTACTEETEGHVKQETIHKASDITLAKKSYEYTGSAITPAVTVKDSEGIVISADNYNVVYTDNTDVGDATVTITFKGDIYEGSVELTFTITEQSAEDDPNDSKDEENPDDSKDEENPDDSKDEENPDDSKDQENPDDTSDKKDPSDTDNTGNAGNTGDNSNTGNIGNTSNTGSTGDANNTGTTGNAGNTNNSNTSNTTTTTRKKATITAKSGKKKVNSVTVKKGKKASLKITTTSKGKLSLSKLTKKQKKIASVTLKSGKLTIKGKKKGTITVTISSAKTNTYKKATKKIKIKIKK